MYTNTLNYLREKGIEKPEIGLILGSGLGDLALEIENPIKVAYSDIPDFPRSTVEGHAGQLVYGDLEGKKVIALQGRFHFYEGYSIDVVTYPVRVFKELGVSKLIVTNAAGGANYDFEVGDLMIIRDHLNLAGQNPLIGANIEEHGPRFPDMTNAYSKEGQKLLHEIGEEQGLDLKEGVYAWFSGPSYETPAEVEMARRLGADACGMSTVPEVIVAKHTGMEVVGISCITNLAAGMQDELDHDGVVDISLQTKPRFQKLVRTFIRRW